MTDRPILTRLLNATEKKQTRYINKVDKYNNNNIISTKSKQIEYVQFALTLSKGRSFVLHCCRFYKVECCFDKVACCFGIVAGVDGALSTIPLIRDARTNVPSCYLLFACHIPTFSEFVQLLDDDVVGPKCRGDG